MNYIVEKIKEDIYVIAVWDNTWNSYNNCYVIIEEKGTILIDTGKIEHTSYLVKGLEQIGKHEKDVNTIIITHGHRDHVGGSSEIFRNAEKYIHSCDLKLLEPTMRDSYKTIKYDEGVIGNLQYILLKHHTEGSIVLYSLKHKIVFVGDFHCFFGESIQDQSIIGNWNEIRVKTIGNVREIVLTEGSFDKYRLHEYFSGLRIIRNFEIDYLCTGHGMVLKGDIDKFLKELISCELT